MLINSFHLPLHLKGVYHSIFAKSSALWNIVIRSTVVCDNVQGVAKRKLIVSTATRQNSYYDAVVRVTDNSSAELNELCAKLELSVLVSVSKRVCHCFKTSFKRSRHLARWRQTLFLVHFCQHYRKLSTRWLVALQPDLSSMVCSGYRKYHQPFFWESVSIW